MAFEIEEYVDGNDKYAVFLLAAAKSETTLLGKICAYQLLYDYIYYKLEVKASVEIYKL